MTLPASSRAQGKLGYQPSLDGLRAISVLAVILYHADMRWVPGGFLGVEVFFVVSGFLITALLVEERHHNGSVSLRSFWARRARRLLPALYVLLIVVPVTMLLFFRDAAGRLGGDVLAALFYVSNWWQIFLDESYFAQAGRPPVLRHLWSLAVEEQFYIIFPIVFVWMLSRHGRDRTRNVLVAVAVLSALWMAWLYSPDVDPSRVYFGTDTRLSGLLLGAVLALVWTPWRSRARPSKAAGPMLEVAGVAALAWLVWFFHRVNEFDPFVYRGGFLLLDVCCVILIAVLVHPSTRLDRLLSWGPLVWVGVRSYSIYLWHWPIFMVTRPDLDLPFRGLPVLVLRIVLTLAAAELSYRFVEQPVRNGTFGHFLRELRDSTGDQRARMQQALFVRGGAVAAVVLLVGVGLWGAATSKDRARLELEVSGAPALESGPVTTNPSVVATSTVAASASDAAGDNASGNPGAEVAGATTVPGAPTTLPAVKATPTDAVAVGDSVMLGASDALHRAMPGLRIDAKVARQFDTLASAAVWYKTSGNLPGTIIVNVGNNGIPQEEDIESMVVALGDRKVILVNAMVERPWEATANDRTTAVAKRHRNVVLADWYSLATKHPDWFVADGTHLRPDGARAYAELIRSKL